jgi:hypothetical protein
VRRRPSHQTRERRVRSFAVPSVEPMDCLSARRPIAGNPRSGSEAFGEAGVFWAGRRPGKGHVPRGQHDRRQSGHHETDRPWWRTSGPRNTSALRNGFPGGCLQQGLYRRFKFLVWLFCVSPFGEFSPSGLNSTLAETISGGFAGHLPQFGTSCWGRRQKAP